MKKEERFRQIKVGNIIPLSYTFSRKWVLGAVSVVFLLAFVVCTSREMGLLFSLTFSLETAGIAAMCWFTARYYLGCIPYALVAAPVILPFFWSLFTVLLPLGFIFGGEKCSPHLVNSYLEAQFWNFIGTVMLCLGLSVFSKRFAVSKTPRISSAGLKKLQIAWWVLLGLSIPNWIQTYKLGLFSRRSIVLDPTPFGWIVTQLSSKASFAVLLLSVFLFSFYISGDRKKKLWFFCQIFMAVLLLLLFLKVQYRWLMAAGFLVFCAYSAHHPHKIKKYFVTAAAISLFSIPVIHCLRTSEFVVGGKGMEQVQKLSGNIVDAIQHAYTNPNELSFQSEFNRCGGTFAFTAETIREIPRNKDYFFGTLFLQNIRLLVPYMLYPSKYASGPILNPETLINNRVNNSYKDTGFSPTIFLWAEGGPILLILGMFLFGLVYGYIYWECISNMESGIGCFLYSFFALDLIQLEGDWMASLSGTIRLCVVALALWYAIMYWFSVNWTNPLRR